MLEEQKQRKKEEEEEGQRDLADRFSQIYGKHIGSKVCCIYFRIKLKSIYSKCII